MGAQAKHLSQAVGAVLHRQVLMETTAAHQMLLETVATVYQLQYWEFLNTTVEVVVPVLAKAAGCLEQVAKAAVLTDLKLQMATLLVLIQDLALEAGESQQASQMGQTVAVANV
jgi:hypothetical protein|tara:strand:- start:212 stop:553 length:342 start_codon:yes stop_codon:yes gene_type:complete